MLRLALTFEWQDDVKFKLKLFEQKHNDIRSLRRLELKDIDTGVNWPSLRSDHARGPGADRADSTANKLAIQLQMIAIPSIYVSIFAALVLYGFFILLLTVKIGEGRPIAFLPEVSWLSQSAPESIYLKIKLWSSEEISVIKQPCYSGVINICEPSESQER